MKFYDIVKVGTTQPVGFLGASPSQKNTQERCDRLNAIAGTTAFEVIEVEA